EVPPRRRHIPADGGDRPHVNLLALLRSGVSLHGRWLYADDQLDAPRGRVPPAAPRAHSARRPARDVRARTVAGGTVAVGACGGRRTARDGAAAFRVLPRPLLRRLPSPCGVLVRVGPPGRAPTGDRARAGARSLHLVEQR